MARIQAVTLDFYHTLIDHRAGTGRGNRFEHYLASNGLGADSWEHQMLYDVFEYFGAEYRPDASEPQKRMFWTEFSRRLFERANVVGYDPNHVDRHAEGIRQIFGPSHFALYREVHDALGALKRMKLRLGVVSNWPRGLQFFCEELGLSSYMDVVIASGELGVEKPDPRIFHEALDKMGMTPDTVLHVGDSLEEDFRGAVAAGLQAVLLDRDDAYAAVEVRKIRHLGQLAGVVEGF